MAEGNPDMPYDPIKIASSIERVVVDGNRRKYAHPGKNLRFYGGVTSAVEVGCNLMGCKFCFSDQPVRKPGRVGKFYTPQEIFDALTAAAKRHGNTLISASASEGTLGRQHLIELLALVDESPFTYVLESNGMLLGNDPGYAQEIAQFRSVHCRISIKGCNEDEYTRITGAIPESYALPYRALEHLMDADVSVNACLMVSFSTDESIRQAKARLAAIRPGLLKSLELETITLFSKVAARLQKEGLKPTRIRHRGRVLRLDTK